MAPGIETVSGNLLHAQTDALVNTVNCEGVMGKGIALQFKQAWPAMFKAYRAACKAGLVVPGRMHVWPTGALQGPRYILNFPTKRHWRDPSRMEDIEAGLVDLVAQLRALGLRSVAIPPLGAGNGGLAWSEVRPRIVRALQSLPEMHVALYEPVGAPLPAEQPVGTERPPFTVARAVFLKLMGRYRGADQQLKNVEIQKLAYFLQVAGQPLRLNFVAHEYGPYADNLHQVMQRLEGHYLRGAVDRRPYTEVELLPGAEAQADTVLATDAEASARLDRVARLVEGFETPHSMELLATVHWVAHHHPEAAQDFGVCLAQVRAWSARKGERMQEQHLQVAWDHLRQLGWMPTA